MDNDSSIKTFSPLDSGQLQKLYKEHGGVHPTNFFLPLASKGPTPTEEPGLVKCSGIIIPKKYIDHLFQLQLEGELKGNVKPKKNKKKQKKIIKSAFFHNGQSYAIDLSNEIQVSGFHYDNPEMSVKSLYASGGSFPDCIHGRYLFVSLNRLRQVPVYKSIFNHSLGSPSDVLKYLIKSFLRTVKVEKFENNHYKVHTQFDCDPPLDVILILKQMNKAPGGLTLVTAYPRPPFDAGEIKIKEERDRIKHYKFFFPKLINGNVVKRSSFEEDDKVQSLFKVIDFHVDNTLTLNMWPISFNGHLKFIHVDTQSNQLYYWCPSFRPFMQYHLVHETMYNHLKKDRSDRMKLIYDLKCLYLTESVLCEMSPYWPDYISHAEICNILFQALQNFFLPSSNSDSLMDPLMIHLDQVQENLSFDPKALKKKPFSYMEGQRYDNEVLGGFITKPIGHGFSVTFPASITLPHITYFSLDNLDKQCSAAKILNELKTFDIGSNSSSQPKDLKLVSFCCSSQRFSKAGKRDEYNSWRIHVKIDPSTGLIWQFYPLFQ